MAENSNILYLINMNLCPADIAKRLRIPHQRIGEKISKLFGGEEMKWTAARDKRLTRLWASGLPTPEIGKRMGVTKNSVIGRAHRLKLPSRRPLKPVVSHFRLPTEPVGGEGVSLLDIKRDECLWPLGGLMDPPKRFCGHKAVFGKPYCSEHLGRATVKGSARLRV